ncbi:hypothetical protein AAVH_29383 [Aphelenchoides avenae]|nr:hypothetical protein AAVH_29383 [Aphelenchus avenae]
MAIRNLVRLAYTDAGGFDDAAHAAIAEAIAEAHRQEDFQQDLMRNEQLMATAQLQLNNQELRNEMDDLRKQFSNLSVSTVQMLSPFSDRPRAFESMCSMSDIRRADSPPPFVQERSWNLGRNNWNDPRHGAFRNQWDDHRRSPPAWQRGDRRNRIFEDRRPQLRGGRVHRIDRLRYTRRRHPQDARDTAVQHDGKYQANSLFRSASPLGMPFLAVFALIIALAAPAHGQFQPCLDGAGDHLIFPATRQPCTPPVDAANADHVNAAILPLSAPNRRVIAIAARRRRTPLPADGANADNVNSALLPLSATNRLVIAIAVTALFVVLVVVAHTFRPHRPPRSYRPPYQIANQQSDADDVLRADVLGTPPVVKNNNQPTTASTICSIEYSAATSRHRFINALLHGRNVLALVDNGAEVTTVRPRWGAVILRHVTTTVSFARHLLQLRHLVAATDTLPAPLIIGLDIFSSLTQPVSFDFINNDLNVTNTTVQLYEMPSTTSAEKFVPSSFGKLLRVPSLIGDSYASTSNNNASPSNYNFAASTTRPSVDTPSTSTNEITTCRQPTTVIAKFNITARPLLVFCTKINGVKTSASFDSTFPPCQCRLSFCFTPRLPFTMWTNTSRSSNGYVNRIFGTTSGVITLGKVTTDSRALLVTAGDVISTDIVFGFMFLQELYSTMSLDLFRRMQATSFSACPATFRQALRSNSAASNNEPVDNHHRSHRCRRSRSKPDHHALNNETPSDHRRSSRLNAKRARLHAEPATSED